MAADSRTPLWFEPVSAAKAARCVGVLRLLHYTSPNQDELVAMADAARAVRGLPPLPAPHCLPKGERLDALTGQGPQQGAEDYAEINACSTKGVGHEARALVEGLIRHLCAVLVCSALNVVLTLGRLGAAWCQIRRACCCLIPCTLWTSHRKPRQDAGARVYHRNRKHFLMLSTCCCAPVLYAAGELQALAVAKGKAMTAQPITGQMHVRQCSKGVTCGRRDGKLQVAHLPALPAKVVNTSGAGDCLVAGAMWSLVAGHEPAIALAHGMVHFMPL